MMQHVLEHIGFGLLPITFMLIRLVADHSCTGQAWAG